MMNSETAWNMFVFRDGRHSVPGSTLARELADAVREIFSRPTSSESPLIDTLVRAGEFECALADAGAPGASKATRVTDMLADMLADGRSGRNRGIECNDLLRLIPEHVQGVLKLSPPEGFAYYALHPLDYSDLASDLPLCSDAALVIGIRSIGVTLSALVAASLRMRGVRVTRTTVRPEGHPYNRRTEFTGDQARLVRNMAGSQAEFVVADEGPGMSGSSFLSVGDALLNCGIPREKVTFLCSRIPDTDTLRAANGGERWRQYRSYYVKKNWRLPDDAKIYVGGGEWRQSLLGDTARWPACWTQMERLKFLSPDRSSLFKFEGFGRFGEGVVDRAGRIAEARFGPAPLDFAQGFSLYPVIAGPLATAGELSTEHLMRMAAYCAFRAREFRCEQGQDWRQMETMVRFNFAQEFGTELPLDEGALASRGPVIADGRMMPHEWIRSRSGELLKVDNASHGDDHFFPGPTDIAWDLAGAIVEWDMDTAAANQFVREYERLSGDHAGGRLPGFLMAYAVFRLGYSNMAAAAMRGSEEERRLTAAYERYRAFVTGMCGAMKSIAA